MPRSSFSGQNIRCKMRTSKGMPKNSRGNLSTIRVTCHSTIESETRNPYSDQELLLSNFGRGRALIHLNSYLCRMDHNIQTIWTQLQFLRHLLSKPLWDVLTVTTTFLIFNMEETSSYPRTHCDDDTNKNFVQFFFYSGQTFRVIVASKIQNRLLSYFYSQLLSVRPQWT